MKIFFLSLGVKLDFDVEALFALARGWCVDLYDFAQLNGQITFDVQKMLITSEFLGVLSAINVTV